MEKIVWDPSYSVGVDILDKQHQQLVRLINLLIDDPEAITSSETISESLTRLTLYAQQHFVTEERILEKYNYPELKQQREEHAEYRVRVAEFCLDTNHAVESVPLNLLLFIRDWWNQHILVSDMQYRPFLAKFDIPTSNNCEDNILSPIPRF